ncbi:MAG TPA: FtsX-like permease family protein [Gemmatimonas sp.]|nr:FtsX-like permease family protein [Gemmatimonas sp.]
MSRARSGALARVSDALSKLLLRWYPLDFREEMGPAMREAYRDRFDDAVRERGVPGLVLAWCAALADAMRNGIGERARPSIRWRRSGRWGRDAERVVKRLVRAPVFALSTIATLGIGLAAFAIVYTAVSNVLLAPMPYDRPDGVYWVFRDYPWLGLERSSAAGTDVDALAQLDVVEHAAAVRPPRGVTLTGAGDGGAERPREVRRMVVSPALFPLLGVAPMLGRVFGPDESGPGRAPHAVLTHGLWASLGADSSLVGRSIRLEGQPFTVIGVMPPSFRFVRPTGTSGSQGADVYTTLEVRLAEADPQAGNYAALLRARDGVGRDQLEEAVASVGRTVDREHFESHGLTLSAVGAHEDLVRDVRPALTVMAVAAALLLAVLVANLTSLLLVRATQREREFAISRALGADGAAIARATVLEGAVLGAIGGAIGAGLAWWGSHALAELTPVTFPRREDLALDPAGALVTVATGLVLGVLAGLIPGVWAARLQLGSLMATANARSGGGRATLRRAMLASQIALSFILLCSGTLVVRTLDTLLRADPGFDPANVTTLRVPITGQRFPEAEDAARMQERIERALAAIPGVTSVGAVSELPMQGSADQRPMLFPGAPGNTGEADHDRPVVDVFYARSGYVETLGARVVEGVPFQRPHRPGRAEVMIDETLARTFFPKGGAVGRDIHINDDTATVTAVLRQLRQYDLHADGRPQVFLRGEDWAYETMSWAIRSSIDPSSLAPAIEAAVHTADPSLAVASVRPMTAVVEDALRERRLTATLVGGFALVALLLTAVGLFGTVASAILRRKHELAVRIALGANHGGVLWMLIRESARLVLIGLLIAVPGFLLVRRVLERVLVGVSTSDPATIAGVALGLAGIALLASYLPARRVLRIHPATALREE